MILDKETMLSGTVTDGAVVGQAITVTAGSTNVLRLQNAAGKDVGPGNKLKVRIQVVTAFATADSAVLQIKLMTGTTAVPDVVLAQTSTIAAATLVAGYAVEFMVPKGALAYIDLDYVVTVGSFSAGKVVASVIDVSQENNFGE